MQSINNIYIYICYILSIPANCTMLTNNHLFIRSNFSYIFRLTEAILRDETDTKEYIFV